MRLARIARAVLASALALACAGAATDGGSGQPAWRTLERDGARLEYTARDAALAPPIVANVAQARRLVATAFGGAFDRDFVARIYPDRASLTARWREAWSQPQLETACWMIAAGWATEIDLLSPGIWPTEACGHDGRDSVHVRLIVTHEIVHVFHSQRNPTPGRMPTAMPWFWEGLAVHLSGQLEREYAAGARAQLAGGFAPRRLAELWANGPAYGLAGSLVSYVDGRFGRERLTALLQVTSDAELIAALGVDEGTLLTDWRTAVLR